MLSRFLFAEAIRVDTIYNSVEFLSGVYSQPLLMWWGGGEGARLNKFPSDAYKGVCKLCPLFSQKMENHGILTKFVQNLVNISLIYANFTSYQRLYLSKWQLFPSLLFLLSFPSLISFFFPCPFFFFLSFPSLFPTLLFFSVLFSNFFLNPLPIFPFPF